MTFTHIVLAVCAAIVVFLLVRGFGGSRINETNHTNERPRLDVVGDALEEKTINTLHHVGKINAVKDLRDATGWSLKEAKHYVDDLQNRYPAPKDQN